LLGGVPLSLRIQNQLHPVSPDDFAYLLHRITLGTGAGELTLVTTHGPLLWCGRPAIPREVLSPHETRPYASGEFGTDDVCTTALSPSEAPSQRAVFRDDWPAAARRAVHELCAAIDGSEDPIRRGQHHLTLCRVWQALTGVLGPPELLKGDALPMALAAEELVELRIAATDAVPAGSPTPRPRRPAPPSADRREETPPSSE
jgi:thiazolinyl imide reductase